MKGMHLLLILPGYILWHYTLAFRDIVHVWGNFMWFVNHQFSILHLISTLFSPWHRVQEGKPENFDIEDYAATIVVNLMSRLVGALMRIIIIAIGLFFMLLTLVSGVLFFLLWIVAPVVVVGLFLLGIYYLF